MRSLTTRLVVTAVALVALSSVLIGVVATFAMSTYLNDQLDDDVRASLGRAFGESPPMSFTDGPGREGPDGRGQGVGTLTARFQTDYRGGEVLVDTRGGPAQAEDLDDDVLDRLTDLPTDGHLTDRSLPGLGEYRLVAVSEGGTTVVAGLPTGEVDAALTRLGLAEGVLILLGTGASLVAGLLVVRRQLAPLREVAGTAHRVAELPLAEGAVDVAERVPPHLTDERTEVGQVGAALNTLLDHVETSLATRHRSEQQVRQFVADASHELRTPLATIRGYAELARRHPDDPAGVTTALGKVEVESSRMAALVEDLLLLARLDAGRSLEQSPVDLTRLLLEAVDDARVLAPDHQWRVALPDEPVEVVGDEQRLHQVVTNLLTNARKYTPAGTTVTVTATAAGFSVHDDGPGFDADLQARAFERFTRGDEARTREAGSSAGLGLALVRAVVEAHGGTVTLSSRPGDTIVRVDLPG